ncbi:MAG: YdeI/OmpD-associated family protein [Solirubrobacteraceae bacterium]
MPPELGELVVANVTLWGEWLEANAWDSVGVWLVLAKKGTSEPTSLSYQDALEEALCHGWIDGQLRRRDEATFSQRFTPRQARSAWSKRNVEIAQRLAGEGRMRPRGAEAVGAAQADGRWERAYAGAARIDVPEDLAAALAAEPAAAAMFERPSSQNRYAILYRIHDAKRAQTRAKRIATYVQMLARGETIHPQKR